MQDGVENIKIRVAPLKIFHILGQTLFRRFGVSSTDSGIIHSANLYHILVKAFVLSWFNKENHSPSHELWQTAVKDFTLCWVEKNFDSFKN